ncbi:MAG: aminotransferase class I/II-fold pyridoxal phosphate-dependent enzyme, partial [Muribaculaceae bacterium]|nr:aminotransferase class I/II-fold pyridoxal phosphate-dependent enzyme [Muribaculaceae bacterium]
MDAERSHLKNLGAQLSRVLKSSHSSHIQPLIIGDAGRALELSKLLKQVGISALAIRTPTVPAGTERLRFSLSASLTAKDVDELENALQRFTL